jgi:hypothetical protein
MTFRTETFTRSTVRSRPADVFVTAADSIAPAMRGEPNVVSIPTKWRHSRLDSSYFDNNDFDVVAPIVRRRFSELSSYVDQGRDVVWPSEGVDTGRAELWKRAPSILLLIEDLRADLEERANFKRRGRKANG